MQGQISIFDYMESNKEYPIEVDIRGLMDDGYCPKCHVSLEDMVSECPYCHTRLSWIGWKQLNNYVQ